MALDAPALEADATATALPKLTWPCAKFSRIPFGVYVDDAIYQAEQERIFRGRTWSYLGLEAEVPNPGDFQTCFVGDTPVLISRDEDGLIHAFVNRCVHRGTIVRRESCGNAKSHVCCYHQWAYNLKGELQSVPFRRG